MTAATTEHTELAEGPVVARIDWAPVPKVNLLPSEILEGRRFRVVQAGLATVVVVTLCVAGAAYWWADRTRADAQEQLDTAQARTLTLQARERSYAEVPKTLAALTYAQTSRATVMANDVAWYRYLSDVADAAPDSVSFTALTFKVPGPSAQGATAASAETSTAVGDPFAPPVNLGTVTIAGISGDYPDVANWMDALDKVTGLDVTTLASAAKDATTGEVSFSSGITITDKALTHRFDRKAS